MQMQVGCNYEFCNKTNVELKTVHKCNINITV